MALGKNLTPSLLHSTSFFGYKVLLTDKAVSSLFIDLKKAFDTVDHKLLLNKIQTLYAHYTVVDWFGSYLSNLKQGVKINNALSEFKLIECGVPQVLGPLLL